MFLSIRPIDRDDTLDANRGTSKPCGCTDAHASKAKLAHQGSNGTAGRRRRRRRAGPAATGRRRRPRGRGAGRVAAAAGPGGRGRLHGVGVGRPRDAVPEAAALRHPGAGGGADPGHRAGPPVVPRRLRRRPPRGAGLRVAVRRRGRPQGQPRLRPGAGPLGPGHRRRRHQDGGGEGVRRPAGAGAAGGGDGRGERAVAAGAGEGRLPEGGGAPQVHRRTRRRPGQGRRDLQLPVVRPTACEAVTRNGRSGSSSEEFPVTREPEW
ncbi:hypothetical protein PVAP13_9NG171673 [Panicum virgatum]|uniref:Uncharacterized protein n=1 Tax=Panicum virgatum TaxID=38727 RepID=A0A8T0MHH8_PANVG|nr:hypothetical protein PVAP13_9NG171673 [Panicum virgatum]